MITLQQFMETVNYRITEGSDYGWDCYGDHTHSLSSWNGVHGAGGWSVDIVFDTQTQVVYEASVCDYTQDRAYRIINPTFVESHKKESEMRGVNLNQAWDETDYIADYIDLEVDGDWLEKAQAIVAGLDYDDRVQMSVDFSDEDLLKYMKAAHQQDVTFNQFVEQAIRTAIQHHQLLGHI